MNEVIQQFLLHQLK